MSQTIDDIKSPIESVARESMENQAIRVNHFAQRANKMQPGETASRFPQQIHEPLNKSSVDDPEETVTNDAFSDSQIGEIADEEDYNG